MEVFGSAVREKSRVGEGIDPLQTRKATKVRVIRMNRKPVLDAMRGDVRIRRQVCADTDRAQKAAEYVPVPVGR